MVELWLTHNLVQQFKTKRETPTSMRDWGRHKKRDVHMHILCFSRWLSLSMSHLLLLLSWRSVFVPEIDREQTAVCNQNLSNWQGWWRRTCLPAQDVPDKSIFKVIFKMSVSALLPVLITNRTNRMFRYSGYDNEKYLHTTSSARCVKDQWVDFA